MNPLSDFSCLGCQLEGGLGGKGRLCTIRFVNDSKKYISIYTGKEQASIWREIESKHLSSSVKVILFPSWPVAYPPSPAPVFPPLLARKGGGLKSSSQSEFDYGPPPSPFASVPLQQKIPPLLPLLQKWERGREMRLHFPGTFSCRPKNSARSIPSSSSPFPAVFWDRGVGKVPLTFRGANKRWSIKLVSPRGTVERPSIYGEERKLRWTLVSNHTYLSWGAVKKKEHVGQFN